MTRRCRSFALLGFAAACFPAAVFSQSSADKPTFDIADVHASPSGDWARDAHGDWVGQAARLMAGGYLSDDRYGLRYATMLDMVRIAYNIDPGRIYGGPSWLDYDRFEIEAKTKPGTSPENLRLMLQALLVDRFGVVVKPDTKLVPGYTLSRADRELKLKAASEAGNPGCRPATRFTIGGGPGSGSIPCRNVSMQTFASILGRVLSSPVAAYQVKDSTGLDGMWDIDIQYDQQPGGIAATNAVIAEEVGKLGLSLEFGKIPQPVLTVEKANEQPTPNPPGVEKAFPPRPAPEFEVASVKLSDGQGPSTPLRFETSGRVVAHAEPPGSLIQQAWGLLSYEQIAGLPKSFSGSSVAKNVTIVAKAPDHWFPDNAANANSQARDILNDMLRTLLIDRYQMKFHVEERPVNALTLTANRPKLTKADPVGRTGCKREDQRREGRALLVKLVCHNMTISQFADQMRLLDRGILYPVHDATGIEGSWDFTLNYDALANLMMSLPAARAPQSDGVEASDPSGALSFQEAVQKQLGLKLETHKRPEKVLVIDHMLEDPIDN